MAGTIQRGGLLVALAGLGLLGLAAAPAAAPAASAAPQQPPRASQQARHAEPAVPAGASFVAAPRVASAGRLRPVCPTPAQPGQMTCMALLPARTGAVAPGAAPPARAYSPAVLQEAYHLKRQARTPPSGGTDTVAVVDAYGDRHAAGDLAVYRARYGLPACRTGTGCLTIVGQNGGRGLPAADPTGAWELEQSLDLDMVSAICPYCRILLVEATSDSIGALATAERYAAQHASAVSNSWGSGAEFVGENAFDADFYWPGVAITAAGGDDGYGTQYPAASPYVTAVGGTSLRGATATSAGRQAAWDDTGSGCSALEPRPSWQAAGPGFPAGCQNRTENDVSAVASLNPGVAVYDSVSYSSGSGSAAPGWTAAGGTSVATPIIAAAYALADISTGKPGTGLVPGTLPAAYPYRGRSDFTDITAGANGGCEASRQYLCHAAAGYDGPTGLGTPDGTAGLLGPASAAVTMIDPGTQVAAAGASVRLAVRSLDSGRGPVSYSAAGLPPGLTLSGGAISGRLTAAAGVYPVTVTAAAGGATGSEAFDIVALARMTDRYPATGPVRLVGGECLTDSGDSLASGARITISACAGPAGQNWEYLPGGSPGGPGRLEIHGKCLTLPSRAASGARITLQSCTGAATQRWRSQLGGQLSNPHSGRCLAGGGGAQGRALRLRSCDGQRAQSQRAQSWKLPSGPVLAGISGQCLTDPADSSRPGTRVVISACRAGRSQRWAIDRDGTIRIRGRCLSVSGDSLLDGAAADLASCGNSLAQRWQPGPHGQLVNASSGRCLSAGRSASAASAQGASAQGAETRLSQRDCYAQPGQIWAGG